MPSPVVAPGVRENTSAKGASTAAAGAVLTYTTPSNRRAEVTNYFDDGVNGAVAVSPELLVGANTFRPYGTLAVGTHVRGAAGVSFVNGGIMLNADEVFRWVVTTAFAATAADFVISVLEEL